MANTILVGAQWGDEGKGKIIDVLTEQADVVVRTQGGNNARAHGFSSVTKIRPASHPIRHSAPEDKSCVIGNGVVIDPVSLVGEIDGLLQDEGQGPDKNLFISETAHLVLLYHRELDEQREILKGRNKIGTTKRGIGPAYGDKAARTGLRMIDLINPDRFETQLQLKIKENNEVLKAFGAKPISFREVHAAYQKAGNRLKPFVTNTVVPCSTAKCAAARTFSLRARRELFSISTTARIPSSRRRTLLPAGLARRFGRRAESHGTASWV